MQRGLVAMGTVAVLTVYSAGYEKTKAAAQRFEDDDAVRRPPPPPATRGPASTTAVAGTPDALVETAARAVIDTALQLEHATSAPQTDAATRNPARATPPASGVSQAPAGGPSAAASVQVAPASATVDSGRASTASVPAKQDTAPGRSDSASVPPDSGPARKDSAPVTPAPAVAIDRAVSDGNAVVADTPAVQASPWEDGTYTGWGTSRHGDIQATVTIEAGRITSARISRCLTRYSCSWIAALPPQVVDRQSPETDYVSGATQSTNAFYYAVVEALGKAKR